MNLKNKKVLVYGLAKSGLAAVNLLLRSGAEVYVCDDNGIIVPENTTAVPDASFSKECDLVVLSPAVPVGKPELREAVKRGIVIGETELASDFLDSELIAVTGTNGKTTVTLMITDILNGAGERAYALGNIGIPLSEKVGKLSPSDVAVTEVSSFQLETIKRFSPDAAVLTNVTSDHLDRHGSAENYAKIKARIFENQIPKDIAVINADDETSVKISEGVKSDLFFFSKNKKVRGTYLEDGEIYFSDGRRIHIASCGELSACAGFNLENALAATTVCMARGVHPEIIRKSLKSFVSPPYRMTYLGEKRGKKFYNDSKGTNVSATIASAKCLSENTVLILGGRSKGENFGYLFEKLPKNVVHVFVTGENSREIMDGALSAGFYGITYRRTLSECVKESVLVHADNVLFSPASSSFDRYADYAARGKAFDELFCDL